MLRIALLICLCGSLLLVPLVGRGQLPEVVFAWEAPDTCPSQAHVRAVLAREVDLFAHQGRPLAASARVTREGIHYRMRLLTDYGGQKGERELSADDCDALVRMVTLVLGLMVGRTEPATEATATVATAPAQSVAQAPSAAAPLPTATEPAVASSAAEQAPAEPAHATGVRPEVLLMAGIGGQLRLLPAAALRLVLGAELAAFGAALNLQLGLLPAVSESPSSAVETSFSGLMAALKGCYGFPLLDALPIAGCVGLSAAALRGQAHGGQVESASATAPFYAAVGSLSATWPRKGLLRARLEAGLTVSLNRPDFVIEGLPRVHRVPRFATDASLFLLLSPF